MAGRWRAVPALAWRDSRAARRRLLLVMSSISLGVAALVAIDSYTANVATAIHQQARTLLGADVEIAANAPFSPTVDSVIDSLRARGITVGRRTSFASMAVREPSGATRLVQVRAVGPGVPFYGTIETLPAGLWPRLQRRGVAVADSSLLASLGAHLGDTLALGDARFVLLGTVRNVPGDIGIESALGPRIYIAERDVAATHLLRFGSRGDHDALLRLPPGMSATTVAAALRRRIGHQRGRVRVTTPRDTERRLTHAVGELGRFLSLAGLIALLLGGIGVASAVHAYVAEKVDTAAVLRCLGATAAQVFAIYLLQAVALGLAGAAIGAVLGVLAQLALPHVIGGFLPVTVTPRLVPGAVLRGLAVGAWTAAMFALLPLRLLGRVSPLEALRRGAGNIATTGKRARRRPDAGVAAILGAIGLSIAAVAIWRAGEVREGLWMTVAIATVLVVLWLAAAALAWLARRVVRAGWPFEMRQGVASLYRPGSQARAVTLALGFGVFLVGTLLLVQASLLHELAMGGTRAQANLAFFDVQSDQAPGLQALIRHAGYPVLQDVPIVPMHIRAIDARSVRQVRHGRGGWALRREYRSSYRDTLVSSERVVAGRWAPTRRASGAPYSVSLEDGVAKELRVGVGDTITWDVQGVAVPTVVTSLRRVEWARFEPNFFAVFDPCALEQAPQTAVVLTRVRDDAARAALQRAAVARYPNVSTIDLALIEQTVSGLLARVSLAVRFMALFSIVTGVVVLVSAVGATRQQRLREAVLLKTLGATRRRIGRILAAEYLVLGILGSATGVALSVAGAALLLHFVFRIALTPAAAPLLAVAAAMVLLTLVIGVTAGRGVLAAPPAAALREL